MDSKQNLKLGIIFAFISMISASLKTALGHNLFEFITPSVFAFLEAFISFMVLVFVYGAMPEFNKLQKLNKSQWLSIILFSMLVTVIGPILFYIGWSMSTANTAFLLGRAEMLFALLFSIVFLKELVSWHQIAGIIIMFSGLAIIATEGGELGMHIDKGAVFILTACVFWGFAIIIFKKYIKNVSLELVLVIRFFLGTIFFFLFLILTQSDSFIKS
ncbi:DMT family transporter, partial [Candidatus Peregrinibacteria bacterium]|nr:DMT family transporter [Candidatus Peregrinibacteria bacterium]